MKRSAWYSSYVLVVLCSVAALNYFDRNLISVLIEPIKLDLKLSDSQLGLLTGLVFAVVYSVAGLPVARLADRFGRVRVLSGALALWSAMTFATGHATSFLTLALARLGVGLGESGGLPTTHALTADYFSAKWRGTALSVIAVVSAAGLSLAMVVGGMISDRWGWRSAFLIAGIPGLVVAALLFFTVKEPARGTPVADGEQAPTVPTFMQAMAILWRRRAFVYLCLGLGIASIGSYGQMIWNTPYIMRTFHMSAGEAGASYGAVTAVATMIGVFIGGISNDFLSRKDARWPFWTLAFCFGVTLPASIYFYVTPDLKMALALILPMTLIGSLWTAPAYTIVQGLSGPKLRSTGAAIFMLMTNLVGLGLGPSLIGWLSDLFSKAHPGEGLRWALLASNAVYPIAVLLFLMATRTVRQDLKTAEVE
jgi:MFS family permease